MSKISERKFEPDPARIEHIFKFMEWDYLSGSQLDLIESFERIYKRTGRLSERQFEILEDIFNKAAAKVEWSR